jgi:O-antigen/teichoic acid export membrane protein
LRKAYIQLIQLTALVLYPLFLGVGMVAPFFITTVFGTTWQASAPLLQMLTLMAFGVPLIWFKSNILIANNKMRQVLEINLIEFAASLAFALAMTPWGVEASALGNTLRILLTAPIILWLIQRHTGTSAMQTLRAVVPPAVAASVMLAVLAFLRLLLIENLGDGLALNLMLIVCGAIVYPAALYVLFPSFCKQTFHTLAPVFKKIR